MNDPLVITADRTAPLRKSYNEASLACYVETPIIAEKPELGQLEATSYDNTSTMKLSTTDTSVAFGITTSGITQELEFAAEQPGYWTLTKLVAPRGIADSNGGPLREGLIYSTQAMRAAIRTQVNAWYIPLV